MPASWAIPSMVTSAKLTPSARSPVVALRIRSVVSARRAARTPGLRPSTAIRQAYDARWPVALAQRGDPHVHADLVELDRGPAPAVVVRGTHLVQDAVARLEVLLGLEQPDRQRL